jgi:hypothetical protein
VGWDVGFESGAPDGGDEETRDERRGWEVREDLEEEFGDEEYGVHGWGCHGKLVSLGGCKSTLFYMFILSYAWDDNDIGMDLTSARSISRPWSREFVRVQEIGKLTVTSLMTWSA